MKYYVFLYWDRKGSGRHYILADNEQSARKKLRQFLNHHHPFRRYSIRLEQVMPA